MSRRPRKRRVRKTVNQLRPIYEALRTEIRQALEAGVYQGSIEAVMMPLNLCDNCRWRWVLAPPHHNDRLQLSSGYAVPIPCDKHADWKEQLLALQQPKEYE